MLQLLHCFPFGNNLRLRIAVAFCMVPLDMQLGGHWGSFPTSFFSFQYDNDT